MSVLVLIVTCASVFAHPGRTDSSGGHTCRTNCEEYGLKTWEFHYHVKVNGKYDYSKHITEEEYKKQNEEKEIIVSEKEKYRKAFQKSLWKRLEKLPSKTLELINKKIDRVLSKDISENKRMKIEALKEVIEDIINSRIEK